MSISFPFQEGALSLEVPSVFVYFRQEARAVLCVDVFLDVPYRICGIRHRLVPPIAADEMRFAYSFRIAGSIPFLVYSNNPGTRLLFLETAKDSRLISERQAKEIYERVSQAALGVAKNLDFISCWRMQSGQRYLHCC
jgi:hypothetical protein